MIKKTNKQRNHIAVGAMVMFTHATKSTTVEFLYDFLSKVDVCCHESQFQIRHSAPWKISKKCMFQNRTKLVSIDHKFPEIFQPI